MDPDNILIYLVPQIHKSILNRLAEMDLKEFQYMRSSNSFQFIADTIMFNLYDGMYHLVINDVKIDIDVANVLNFWF